MKLKILGSGREVGKSSILFQHDKRVMLDFGVKVDPSPPAYPPYEKVDAVVLSHSHLDHCGAIPLLFKKGKIPVYMTDLTMELSAMIMRDSMKVARKEGFPTPFGKAELKRVLQSVKTKQYHEKFRIGNAQFSLWDSGHIPGSASVLINAGKRIYYTSDIQTTDSHLLRKCTLPKGTDVLIVESTYGDRNHPDRRKLEQQLIETVEEAIANEESAIMPAFAIGRVQEVAMILEKYASKIAIDGMARLASDIISDYSYYLRDPKKYKSVMHRTHFVRKPGKYKETLDKFPIVISSAGMLGGGPIVSYLREISHRHGSKVIFTGFLGDDTPGRALMETNIYKNTDEEFRVNCELKQFGLSAHTDRKGIFSIINHMKPKTVICLHGEHCEHLAKDIEEHFKIQAFAPRNGEEIRV